MFTLILNDTHTSNKQNKNTNSKHINATYSCTIFITPSMQALTKQLAKQVLKFKPSYKKQCQTNIQTNKNNKNNNLNTLT